MAHRGAGLGNKRRVRVWASISIIGSSQTIEGEQDRSLLPFRSRLFADMNSAVTRVEYD